MIEQDDVIYLDGKLYVVRLVAETSYVMRESLGKGELGGYVNLRHGAVEFNRTLSFVGTWNELTSTIEWDRAHRPVELPPAPLNVVVANFGNKKLETRKAHNKRVLAEFKENK